MQITYQNGGGSAQHVLTTAACTAGKTLQKTFNDLHFNAHQGLKVNMMLIIVQNHSRDVHV